MDKNYKIYKDLYIHAYKEYLELYKGKYTRQLIDIFCPSLDELAWMWYEYNCRVWSSGSPLRRELFVLVRVLKLPVQYRRRPLREVKIKVNLLKLKKKLNDSWKSNSKESNYND